MLEGEALPWKGGDLTISLWGRPSVWYLLFTHFTVNKLEYFVLYPNVVDMLPDPLISTTLRHIYAILFLNLPTVRPTVKTTILCRKFAMLFQTSFRAITREPKTALGNPGCFLKNSRDNILPLVLILTKYFWFVKKFFVSGKNYYAILQSLTVFCSVSIRLNHL